MLLNHGTDEERLSAAVLNLAHVLDQHYEEIRDALLGTGRCELARALAAAREVWYAAALEAVEAIRLGTRRHDPAACPACP